MNAVLAGVLGPLVAVVVTWIAVVRTYRRNPVGVTNLMVGAFLVKAIFFAAYVIVMIRLLAVEPGPFVASFAISFIALYAVQFVMLSRLFRRGVQEGR